MEENHIYIGWRRVILLIWLCISVYALPSAYAFADSSEEWMRSCSQEVFSHKEEPFSSAYINGKDNERMSFYTGSNLKMCGDPRLPCEGGYLTSGDKIVVSHFSPNKQLACIWFQDKKWHRFGNKVWQDKLGWMPVEALEKIKEIRSASSKEWIGHWVDDQNNGTVVIMDAGEGKLNIRGAVIVEPNHRGMPTPIVVPIVNGTIEFKDDLEDDCHYRMHVIEERLILDIDGSCSNRAWSGVYKKVSKNSSDGLSDLDPDDHHKVSDLSNPDIDKWNNCDHQLFEYYSDLAPSFKKGLIAGKPNEKIFFYENRFNNIYCPEGGASICKKQSYLIPGDKVIVLEHPKTPNQHFSCVLFLNTKGKETIGWIPSQAIASITSISSSLQPGEWINYETGDRIILSDTGKEQLKVSISSPEKNALHIETVIDKKQSWKEQRRVWLQSQGGWMSMYLTFLESVIILNHYNPELQGIYVQTR